MDYILNVERITVDVLEYIAHHDEHDDWWALVWNYSVQVYQMRPNLVLKHHVSRRNSHILQFPRAAKTLPSVYFISIIFVNTSPIFLW